jgi:hypothetical protein
MLAAHFDQFSTLCILIEINNLSVDPFILLLHVRVGILLTCGVHVDPASRFTMRAGLDP